MGFRARNYEETTAKICLIMKILQLGAKVGVGTGIGKGNAGDTAIGTAFDNLFKKEFQLVNVYFLLVFQ